MSGDGGFERTLVNKINETPEDKYYAYRRKQHRFSSQDIDILVDSKTPEYYLGIECKSMKIKDRSSKLYFSQHFSKNKNDEHQIPRITEFLSKTGRKGVLAIAYRQGRGKKIQYYAINWAKIQLLFEKDVNGIEKNVVEEHGVKLNNDFSNIFKAVRRNAKD